MDNSHHIGKIYHLLLFEFVGYMGDVLMSIDIMFGLIKIQLPCTASIMFKWDITLAHSEAPCSAIKKPSALRKCSELNPKLTYRIKHHFKTII